MSTPIHRNGRNKHTAAQQQLGKRRGADNGSEALADNSAERTMKLQTNVKAGGGCGGCGGSLIDLDVNILVVLGLFGGHKRRGC